MIPLIARRFGETVQTVSQRHQRAGVFMFTLENYAPERRGVDVQRFLFYGCDFLPHAASAFVRVEEEIPHF